MWIKQCVLNIYITIKGERLINNSKKIAAFDLDDTLYKGNSHFLILNQYYKTCFYTSLFAKILGKFFSDTYLNLAYYMYNKIPYDYRSRFRLPYRNDVMEVFEAKKKAGYHMVIISNAPLELVESVAKDLGVDYIKAGIGEKAKDLNEKFVYDELFVCTDNSTDLDLINIANEAVITCPIRKRKFFQKKITIENYKFIEELWCRN